MPVVPFEAPKEKVPEQMPRVDPITLAMTEAMLIEERKAEEWQRVLAQTESPMLKRLDDYEWGDSPAQLYNEYRQRGFSPEDAREGLIQSIMHNEKDMTREQIEERLRNQPMS